WTPRRHALQWLAHWFHSVQVWLNRLDDAHPLIFQVVLWSSIVLLVAILVHFGYVAWRIYRSTVHPGGRGVALAAAGLRLDDAQAHLERAEELARVGHYTEALAQRFSAVILQLERARAVRFHPSKT